MPRKTSRKRRLCKQEPDQPCSAQFRANFDLPNGNKKSGEETPACQLGNSDQSPQQIPHDCKHAIRNDVDASNFEIPPVRICMSEQPAAQAKHIRSEPSDPTDPNQTISQMTQDGEDSVKLSKAKRRRRRARRLKKENLPVTQQPVGENIQTDRTATNPAKSLQSTDPQTYYAIRNGAYGYNGVHTDWNVCARYLKDTCGATFKSFSTLDEAFKFAHGDGSPERPSPQKKRKSGTCVESAYVRNDTSRARENENRSLEDVEAANGIQPRDSGYCPYEQAARTVRPLDDIPPSQDDRLLNVDHPPELVEPPREPQIPKEIQAPTRIQPPEEVRLQSWKVEPVLYPASLFSSEPDTAVKREQSVEPGDIPF